MGESDSNGRFLYLLMLLLMVALMTGPSFINLLSTGRPPETLGVVVSSQVESSPLAGQLRQLLSLTLLAISGLTLLRDRGRHISRGLRAWPLLVVWLTLWVSLELSQGSLGIFNLMTPVLTLAVASTVRDIEQLGWVAYLAAGCAVLSWIMAFALPDIAWMQTEDATKVLLLPSLLAGPFGHANTLGQVLALSLPFVLFIRRRVLRHSLGTLIILTLAATGSRTGLVAVGAVIILVLLAAVIRHLRLSPLVVRDGALVAVLLTLLMPLAFLFTNEPGRFTGRGRIWMASRELAEGHAIIGQGPQFFDQSARSSTGLGQAAFHAHNLILHVFVIGGVVGSIVILLALALTLAKAQLMVRAGTIAPVAFLVSWLTVGWLEVPYDFFTVGALILTSLVPWAGILAADPPRRAPSQFR